MTDAAKWKEFLRWWKKHQSSMIDFGKKSEMNPTYAIITMIGYKIDELQKGDNAKQGER